jgi:hypothetical protein
MILTLAALLSMAAAPALSQQWVFADRAGGGNDDYGARVTTDADGNSYAVGEFSGTASFDTVSLTGPGRWNVYLAKYDRSGRIAWAAVVAHTTAATSDLYANAVAVDRWGDIYIAGRFVTDVTFSGETRASRGYSDMYLAKLNRRGELLWLRTPGGVGNGTYGQDAINAIALDSSGNCYVAGSYNTDALFDTIALSSQLTYELFVAKYDSAGKVVWVRSGESPGALHIAQGIAVDPAGNCYVTGKFFNTLTLGSYTFDAGDPEQKAFIAKADPDGAFLWAKEVGSGGYYGAGQDVAVDEDGSAYVVGQFRATINLGDDQHTYNNVGSYALLVVAYDRDGKYTWSVQSDGVPQSVSGAAVRVDRRGRIFVAGGCGGTVSFGTTTFDNPEGHGSAFVAELDREGTFLMANRIVGLGSASATGLAITSDGDPVIIGSFSDSIAAGTGRLQSAGKLDMFFARLGLGSTGVESPAVAEAPLSLHPNPAADIVRLGGVSPLSHVVIFSLDGVRVLESSCGDGIDIGGLPSGSYLVKAGRRVGRLVKIGGGSR